MTEFAGESGSMPAVTTRIRKVLGGTLLGALGLLPPAFAAVDLEETRVTRPGVLLFDREQRKETLAAMAPGERASLCGADRGGWPKHGVVRNVYNGKQPGENVAFTLMTGAAAAFGTDDEAARAAVVDNLTRWARGGALERFKKDPAASMFYNLDRTLLPVIVAFSLVRDHPDMAPEDRAAIEQWLDQLVWRRGPNRERDPKLHSSRNNHRLLSDSVTMAWGALQGSDELFRAGVEGYLTAIQQMRPDGSLPLETARGARALSYQRHAIASMIAIAEMAATQGYDLYAVEGDDGQSIHRAITFLLDGIDNPELVWPYAMENSRPGPNKNYRVQDMGFMVERGHGRHYMAWTEAYMARFPESDIARRLRQAVTDFGTREPPLIDDYSGGSMSCFFTLPGQADQQS